MGALDVFCPRYLRRPTRWSGRASEGAELTKLSAYYATQPGYIEGYLLLPHAEANPPALGRFGAWESDKMAEEAAQAEHGMALRAELLRLIHEESHLELTFVGERDFMK